MKDETNLNDLISRQAAIDELTENKEMINAVLDSLTLDYNTRRNQEQRRGQINEDIETIKALPSAQTEIIKCKDCVWGMTGDFSKKFFCSLTGALAWAESDSFCSYGVRKING